MLKLLYGNINKCKKSIPTDASFVADVITYLNNVNNLFGITAKDVYCLYSTLNLEKKIDCAEFENLCYEYPYTVYVVIETQLDKSSAFYKYFSKTIKVLEQLDASPDIKTRYKKLVQNIESIMEVPDKDLVSLYYTIYYGSKNKRWKEVARNLILWIVQGDVTVQDSRLMFLYLI